MKLTKEMLTEMVKEVIQEQMEEIQKEQPKNIFKSAKQEIAKVKEIAERIDAVVGNALKYYSEYDSIYQAVKATEYYGYIENLVKKAGKSGRPLLTKIVSQKQFLSRFRKYEDLDDLKELILGMIEMFDDPNMRGY